MAIIREKRKNRLNKECIFTYSDKNMYIERDGNMYESAEDLVEYEDERIYIETDIPIKSEEV